MTQGYPNQRPFSMTVIKHTGNFSGTAGTMMTRAPWQAPINKYYVIRKLIITNMTSATSGLGLGIWDQDLSNTSPVARGSAGGPLMFLPVTTALTTPGPGNAVFIGRDQMPGEYFQAGVTMTTYTSGVVATATSGVFVTAELDVV